MESGYGSSRPALGKLVGAGQARVDWATVIEERKKRKRVGGLSRQRELGPKNGLGLKTFF
jgi:hypothetical protein